MSTTLNSPFAQIAWGGKTYTRRENGTIEVPDEAKAELVGLGCKPMSGAPEILDLDAKPAAKKKG